MNQGTNWYRHMGNNHKKKKENITGRKGGGGGGGGNDIAGLIVAVVGFIAVVTFSITKHRTKPKPKPQNSLDQKCNKNIEDHEIETNEGLHALLQPSTIITKDEDVAPCQVMITDAKSINHTFIEEEKIESVSEIETISEVVSETSFHHDEIVLSDDFNSESVVSEAEKMDDDDDEAVVSEIVEEIDCSSNTILHTAEKQDFDSKDEGGDIGMQNEEHVAEKTDTEVADEDDVNVEAEITCEDDMNDQDHEPILVSNSNQFSTLLLLLPGLLLLLVLLLLMHFTKNIFSAIGL
ncbi:unnamed protein product [Lathyrus sativus]|nr:unnamed protein product [Lathyrus sativus]